MTFYKERWLRAGGRFRDVWAAAHGFESDPAQREHLGDVCADLAQLMHPPPGRPPLSLRLGSTLVYGTTLRTVELADDLLEDISKVYDFISGTESMDHDGESRKNTETSSNTKSTSVNDSTLDEDEQFEDMLSDNIEDENEIINDEIDDTESETDHNIADDANDSDDERYTDHQNVTYSGTSPQVLEVRSPIIPTVYKRSTALGNNNKTLIEPLSSSLERCSNELLNEGPNIIASSDSGSPFWHKYISTGNISPIIGRHFQITKPTSLELCSNQLLNEEPNIMASSDTGSPFGHNYISTGHMSPIIGRHYQITKHTSPVFGKHHQGFSRISRVNTDQYQSDETSAVLETYFHASMPRSIITTAFDPNTTTGIGRGGCENTLGRRRRHSDSPVQDIESTDCKKMRRSEGNLVMHGSEVPRINPFRIAHSPDFRLDAIEYHSPQGGEVEDIENPRREVVNLTAALEYSQNSTRLPTEIDTILVEERAASETPSMDTGPEARIRDHDSSLNMEQMQDSEATARPCTEADTIHTEVPTSRIMKEVETATEITILAERTSTMPLVSLPAGAPGVGTAPATRRRRRRQKQWSARGVKKLFVTRGSPPLTRSRNRGSESVLETSRTTLTTPTQPLRVSPHSQSLESNQDYSATKDHPSSALDHSCSINVQSMGGDDYLEITVEDNVSLAPNSQDALILLDDQDMRKEPEDHLNLTLPEINRKERSCSTPSPTYRDGRVSADSTTSDYLDHYQDEHCIEIHEPPQHIIRSPSPRNVSFKSVPRTSSKSPALSANFELNRTFEFISSTSDTSSVTSTSVCDDNSKADLTTSVDTSDLEENQYQAGKSQEICENQKQTSDIYDENIETNEASIPRYVIRPLSSIIEENESSMRNEETESEEEEDNAIEGYRRNIDENENESENSSNSEEIEHLQQDTQGEYDDIDIDPDDRRKSSTEEYSSSDDRSSDGSDSSQSSLGLDTKTDIYPRGGPIDSRHIVTVFRKLSDCDHHLNKCIKRFWKDKMQAVNIPRPL